ncbi:hypothetical protein BDV25DRAFT_165063 [Aspergillus avenaceus]|uniref:Uncharacterized protein n=1 Tax=Aspergillus avenaceus TaxID=36643 RepID=A0A5N6TG33_ASPAV|nr:hypothetical protein BDV25DRAFT_165063 [Aspergillus avenaceus]
MGSITFWDEYRGSLWITLLLVGIDSLGDFDTGCRALSFVSPPSFRFWSGIVGCILMCCYWSPRAVATRVSFGTESAGGWICDGYGVKDNRL